MTVEINDSALAAFESEFPESYEKVDIYNSEIEEVIEEFESDSVEVTYTMSFLMHIHPEKEFVFEEIARITTDYIITLENEYYTGHAHFPRNYNKVFSEYGFEQIQMIDVYKSGIDTGLGNDHIVRVLKNRNNN